MDEPSNYRIKVRGLLPDSWLDRVGNLEIVTITPQETILEGRLPDQAALNGVLDTLYELRLPILEVLCLEKRSKSAQSSNMTPRTKRGLS